jgi:hypothetical protein
MLFLSKTIFVYWFYKILVIEPTTEVKADSIGAPSVKEIGMAQVIHTVYIMYTKSQKIKLQEKYWQIDNGDKKAY